MARFVTSMDLTGVFCLRLLPLSVLYLSNHHSNPSLSSFTRFHYLTVINLFIFDIPFSPFPSSCFLETPLPSVLIVFCDNARTCGKSCYLNKLNWTELLTKCVTTSIFLQLPKSHGWNMSLWNIHTCSPCDISPSHIFFFCGIQCGSGGWATEVCKQYVSNTSWQPLSRRIKV